MWLHDGLDGTTRIEAVTGTPDATAFDTTLNDVAATLSALGDTDPTQVRRAKAVGVLADPQYALDLAATADLAADGEGVTGRPVVGAGRSTRRPGPTVHVHLHTAALSGSPEAGAPVEPVARVAGGGTAPGARSTAAVEQWLRDLAPGVTVTLTPVVDLTQSHAVNAYEVPDRLRAQVAERDDGCRFPWCGRAGVHDLDHIEPYRTTDPDHSGGPPPPGQTSTDKPVFLE